jgi:xanthine dehydrogenase iron-sulfur cluster and FAD-binding subunit A
MVGIGHGGMAVLQKLGDHIEACLECAAKAERRAAETTDPDIKADYIALAGQWTHLARSYEFAESLERFLLDSQKAKDALRPQPPPEK